MNKVKVSENGNLTIEDYVVLRKSWDERGIDVDSASEEEVLYMQKLKDTICAVTGLNNNELALIYLCRTYKVFPRINRYAQILAEQEKEIKTFLST